MKKIISPALLFIAAAIWGFAFSAQKEASSTPPFTLGTLRSLLAAVFLAVVILASDRIKKSERRLFSLKKGSAFRKEELISGCVCGIILALTNLFQQTGLSLGTSASKASFIIALYIVLVPVYELFLKKLPEIKSVISLLIAVPGFYFLCISDSLTLALSDLFIIGSVVIFPIYILTVDKYSGATDPLRMSFIQFAVSTLISAVPALIFEYPINNAVVLSDMPYILILGIGSSGIAYTLQIIGQKGVKPTASALILSLESVFGVLGAVIFLGEGMKPNEIIGACLVFLAVILSQIDLSFLSRRKQNKT